MPKTLKIVFSAPNKNLGGKNGVSGQKGFTYYA